MVLRSLARYLILAPISLRKHNNQLNVIGLLRYPTWRRVYGPHCHGSLWKDRPRGKLYSVPHDGWQNNGLNSANLLLDRRELPV